MRPNRDKMSSIVAAQDGENDGFFGLDPVVITSCLHAVLKTAVCPIWNPNRVVGLLPARSPWYSSLPDGEPSEYLSLRDWSAR
jgi:hypothetical protein